MKLHAFFILAIILLLLVSGVQGKQDKENKSAGVSEEHKASPKATDDVLSEQSGVIQVVETIVPTPTNEDTPGNSDHEANYGVTVSEEHKASSEENIVESSDGDLTLQTTSSIDSSIAAAGIKPRTIRISNTR